MDHKVEVIKIAPHLGAEIRGIDLSRELTDQEFEAAHAAFVEYEVVVFHGQKIVAEQQIAFGQRFGELSVHPFSPNLEEMPELIIFDNNEDNQPLAPTAGIPMKHSAWNRRWAPCCRQGDSILWWQHHFRLSETCTE